MELSLKDIKELLCCTPKTVNCESPFVGKIVLVRSNLAGVHMGKCLAHDLMGNTILLTGAYRLWQWKAIEGIALSGVALHGCTGKIDTETPLHQIGDVVEVIEASEIAYKSLK